MNMFHKDKSKTKASLAEVKHKHSAERMSRVCSSAQLLVTEKKQAQIAEFKKLSGFSEEVFDRCCQSLLDELSLYLQDLPETRNSYFSSKGGFLNHMLSRCEASLKACRAYFVNDKGKETKELSEQQQLWLYCLFSASLLRGIGTLVVDFLIDIFDGSGRHLGKWDPMAGSLPKQDAVFYDYDFDAPHHETFKRRVTLSLATKIMPSAGLGWLSGNKEVFAIWLALLDEDLRSAGTLGIILDKADQVAINRYFNERMAEQYNQETDPGKLVGKKFSAVEGGLSDMAVGELPPSGVEFMKWLSKMLGTAQLMINQAPLFSVPGGLLMSPDIFKLFIRDHPQFKNWQNVQDAFTQMKMHAAAADGGAVQKFKDMKSNSMHTGVVLSSVGLVLPDTFKAVNMKNGVVKSMGRNGMSVISQQSGHMVAEQLASNPLQAISKSGQFITPGGLTQTKINPFGGTL